MAADSAHRSELNRPAIVGFLFLLGALTGGAFALIGLLLAYMWSGRSHAAWETSHYIYLMRTFWIEFVANLAAGLIFLIGFWQIGLMVFGVVALWSLVRAIASLSAAQRHDPLPNPLTFAF